MQIYCSYLCFKNIYLHIAYSDKCGAFSQKLIVYAVINLLWIVLSLWGLFSIASKRSSSIRKFMWLMILLMLLRVAFYIWMNESMKSTIEEINTEFPNGPGNITNTTTDNSNQTSALIKELISAQTDGTTANTTSSTNSTDSTSTTNDIYDVYCDVIYQGGLFIITAIVETALLLLLIVLTKMIVNYVYSNSSYLFSLNITIVN